MFNPERSRGANRPCFIYANLSCAVILEFMSGKWAGLAKGTRWLKSGRFFLAILYSLFSFARPLFGQASNLTPEEAARPWERWTKEQIQAKGWIPYNCFGQTERLDPVGKRWPKNDPDSTRLGTCITYSFIKAPVAMDIGVNSFPGSMPAGTMAEVTIAINSWAAATDVHFQFVLDNGLPHNAAGAIGDIRIGAHLIDTVFEVLAHAFFPPPGGISAAGDFHFDDAETWSLAPSQFGEFDIQTVALHELGHSLGLNHAGAFPEDVMFGSYNGVKRVLTSHDIANITSIYGPGGHQAQCRSVPALSYFGLIILALLLAGTGMWLFRKKFQASQNSP